MIAAPSIVAQLTGDTGVSGFVSARVFPFTYPQIGKTLPVLAYSFEDTKPEDDYDGLAGLVEQKFRITCISNTATEVAQLAIAVLLALTDKAGTWGGMVVQGCFFESQQSIPPEAIPGMGPNSNAFCEDMEFSIWVEFP